MYQQYYRGVSEDQNTIYHQCQGTFSQRLLMVTIATPFRRALRLNEIINDQGTRFLLTGFKRDGTYMRLVLNLSESYF